MLLVAYCLLHESIQAYLTGLRASKKKSLYTTNGRSVLYSQTDTDNFTPTAEIQSGDKTPDAGNVLGSINQDNGGARVYTPKSRRGVPPSHSNGGGSSGGGGGTQRTYNGGTRDRNSYSNNGGSSATGGRSYTPRGRGGPRPGGGGGGGNAFYLHKPQLLVRYRVPRIKSEFKIELEGLQEQYTAASDDWSGGDYYGARDIFDTMTSNTGGGKGKKGGRSTSQSERKGSEGTKPKNSGSDRRLGTEERDDEYDDEEDDDDDYYGDEINVSLSIVPPGALRTMEQEGYSLEEMQMSVYSEYGVKASIMAIRRKLQESRNMRRGKKKTGKTRRERSKKRNARFNPVAEEAIEIPETPIQVQDLASLIDIGAGEIVKHLMLNKGIMATMTQCIEPAIAIDVAKAFGKVVAGEEDDDEDYDDNEEDEEDSGVPTSGPFKYELDVDETVMVGGNLVERLARSPVVTVMGHVDHGKTSLLDRIRQTKVAAGEAGGITQAISAFKVLTDTGKEVTFFDTPGHAAFSEMRKRGATVTDIIVLVVAADDGIMEQTKECIVAAKTANCPIVVAINKVDKEGADAQRVITDLTAFDVVVEDFGGEAQCAQVSAKTGQGLDELLEKILVQSDIMNLRAAYDCPAEGTVIEASISKGLGTIVTALVQQGNLKIGDNVLAGPSWGRVRRILSDEGEDLIEAGPSTPVQIVGLNSVPNAGDPFIVTSDEAGAREVAEARQRIARQSVGQATAGAIMATAAGFADGVVDTRETLKVPIVIKGDVAGSIEALRSSIEELELSDDEAICKPDIIYSGVGDVTSSDIAIATTSKAKVVAFNVAAANNAMDDARASNIEIGYYSVVYELLKELEDEIRVALAPPPPGNLIGRATIQKIFKVGKVGKVAGCLVTEGSIKSDSKVRVMRGKRQQIYIGSLSSLKLVKDSVGEVPDGTECGMSFTDFQDFEEDDVIECFVGGSTENKDDI